MRPNSRDHIREVCKVLDNITVNKGAALFKMASVKKVVK